jgi:hypothetical protein
MRNTLEQNPDVSVVLEYAPAMMRELGFSPPDLIQFLTRRGLECYLIGPKGALSPGVPTGMGDAEYVHLLFSCRPLLRNGGI